MSNALELEAASLAAEEALQFIYLSATMVRDGDKDGAKRNLLALEVFERLHGGLIQQLEPELANAADGVVTLYRNDGACHYTSGHSAVLGVCNLLTFLASHPNWVVPDQLIDWLGLDTSLLRACLRRERAKYMAGQQQQAATKMPSRTNDGGNSKGVTQLEAVLEEGHKRVLAIAKDETKSVDAKMKEIVVLDRCYLGYKATKWAELFEVSDAAVRKTECWKLLQERKRIPD